MDSFSDDSSVEFPMDRFCLFSPSLPENFARRVIQCMPDMERISISFCSRRTKAMAISPRKDPGRRLTVKIGGLYISFYVGDYRNEEWRNQELEDECMWLTEGFEAGRRHILWMQPGWTLFERVNHVTDLFPNVYSTATFNSGEFDLDLLPQIRRSDISEIRVSEREQNNNFNRQILNFFNKENGIALGCPRFGSGTEVAKILIRNLHYLEIHHAFKINLDELLMTNAQYILLNNQNFSAKEINKFLQMWVRGGKPRIRSFEYMFDGPMPNQNLFLTGIKSQLLPETTKSRFLYYDGRRVKICGGYQIYNQNGIKGIVRLHDMSGNRSRLAFAVIDDS